jgi:hypothetical protein
VSSLPEQAPIADAEQAVIDAREEERRRIHRLLLANGWSPRAIRGAERRIHRQARHRASLKES